MIEFDKLNAYVDGELDAQESASVAQAIADDPGLARRVSSLTRLRSSVAEGLEAPVIPLPEPPPVHGHAWAGDNAVARIDLPIDFGVSWIKAKLESPANPYAWQNFTQTVRLPQEGYYEIWARATDDANRMQPFAIAWNPKGYMNNSMHRVSVFAS